MNAMTKGCALAVGLLSMAMAAEADAPGGRGEVSKDGQTWTVADVLAWQDGDEVNVVFSSVPLDRKAITKDGRIDDFDFMGTDGSTLTINLRADGPTQCFSYRGNGSGGSACDSNYRSALQLTRNEGGRVAGRIDWSDGEDTALKLSFDLNVITKVERPGKPLPADGGEPGRAVLAHFAAIASGDLARIKAVSHPDRVAMLSEEEEAEFKGMIGFMQAMTPTEVRITGGSVDGNSAIVDYMGKRNGEAVSGSAEVERVSGRWYVTGTSTRN